MYPQSRHPGPAPHQPGQPFKFTVAESCDRIKEEFSFLQAQYHSLKMECEKLAQEKTEMQRHYVMYYEMSYGLNVEMHKQTEIAKRLNAICAQIIPFLSQEHQQQVAAAVERAKQVTMTELNAIIGQQSAFPHFSGGQGALQHPLPHAHAPPVPMPPHPGSLPPGMSGPGSGLLQLSNAMLNSSGPHGMSSVKDEKERERAERERNSVSPVDRERERDRAASADKHMNKYPEHGESSSKQNSSHSTPNNKRKRDDKDSGDSDGDKSDDNLVVDVSNEDAPSPGRPNGEQSSPRENSADKHRQPKKERPNSPNSIASSASTPNSKHKDGMPNDTKPPTSPGAKSETPTSGGAATPGSSSSVPGIKPPPVGKVPPLAGNYPFMPGQPGLPNHGDLPNPYVAGAGLHNNISPGGAYRGPMGWLPVSQEESRKLSSLHPHHSNHHHPLAAAMVHGSKMPVCLPPGSAAAAAHGQGCAMQ